MHSSLRLLPIVREAMDIIAFFIPFLRISWGLMLLGMALASLETPRMACVLMLAAASFLAEAAFAVYWLLGRLRNTQTTTR